MRYISFKLRPKHFHSFTGLKVEEFDRLAAAIRTDWVRQRLDRLEKNNPNRKRKVGGGRNKALPALEDQLLLTIMWAKLYSSYLMLEYLFGVDETTAFRTIRETTPLLQDRFVFQDPRASGRKKITTIEELKKLFPDIDDILADATEQVIPRPESKRKRKPYHSGKKRKFTLKTKIATKRNGLILHVSPTVGGRMHDYTLFKQSGLPQTIPKDMQLFVDNGYQGVKKDYPNLTVSIPFKRHRGHPELTRSEKIFNKKQRRVRIKVENTIAKLKKYRVLSDVYRHSLQNYNQTFRFVANIVNFRMIQRLQTS